MPSAMMTTDIPPDFTGRKRSHGDFLQQGVETITVDLSLSDKENDVHFTSAGSQTSTPVTCSPGFSELGCSPLDGYSPSSGPNPMPLSTSSVPAQPRATTAKGASKKAGAEPPKKKRLTAEEKAVKDAKVAAEKLKRAEEQEKKRRKKEEADKVKAEQKAKKEQQKKQRAEEKEQKRREKEEEEAKKTRSQIKLTSMFKTGPTNKTAELPSSKSNEAYPGAAPRDGSSKQTSLYEQMFKPFFVKEHVRLASNPFELDEETREAKTKILDDYLLRNREGPTRGVDPLKDLQIPCKVRRGRVYPSVRKLMAEYESLSSKAPVDVATESQNAQIRYTREALKLVPVKSIKFKQDVRPPYIGTISNLPGGDNDKSLQKLARKPISRNILPLNYDYDSEAEWQEEEGEDVDDPDDEEDEGDVDEDMADFLDDSEDAGPARLVFSGGMEPEAVGPCWEDRTRKTREQKMYKHRLEFILEPLEHHHSIDPFSTAYWETPKSKADTGNGTSTTSASASATIAPHSAPNSANDARANGMAPPPLPSDAPQAPNPGSARGSKKSYQPLPPALQEELKALVRKMPRLTKVGVIELFASEHEHCSRAQIRVSFDALFEKSGKVFKVRRE